jgi:geranylgeranyl pyrophosphate synthase
MKTASLIANGCRSAAILSNEKARGSLPCQLFRWPFRYSLLIFDLLDESILEMATEYGRNLGLAFQVTDDLLDFTGSQEDLGKAPAVDLSLGLATAPGASRTT